MPFARPRRELHATVIGITAAVAALLGIMALALLRGRTDEPIRSLAVMPFVNDTSDAANEHLSDGITESIIRELSNLPGLTVVSHASVLRYKRSSTTPEQAARELNVQAVLTGRIDGSKDALTITTELIDGRDLRHLWGERFATRLDDLPAAQAAISRRITDRLRIELTERRRPRPRSGTTPG